MYFARPAWAAFLRCLVLVPILSPISAAAWAGWLPDGVPVCTAAGYQGSLATAPDGAGGMLLAWVDYRIALEQRIYAQRVDIDGNVLWTTDGVLVGGNPGYHPGICPDRAGGAF